MEWNEAIRGRSFHSKLFASILNFQATEQPTRTEINPTDFCGGTVQLDPKTGAVTSAASDVYKRQPKDSPAAGATRYGHGLTRRRTMEKTGGERDYGDIFLAKMELMS